MTTLSSSILRLVVCLFLIAGALRPTSATTTLLFIGDSSTQGLGPHGGYRDPFIRILRGENVNGVNPAGTVYDFRVVGTMSLTLDLPDNSSFPNSLALHPNHEGHAGWSAEHILNGHPSPSPNSGTGSLSDWLASYPYPPDLVLLHIGNNDANTEGNEPGFAATTRSEIKGIIELLRAANPQVHVFLAKIIPPLLASIPSRFHWVAATDAVNAAAASVAAELNQAAARPFVHLVDQNTGFDTPGMTNGSGNPNTAGEAFMAANWFAAMKWALDGLEAPPIVAHFGPVRLLCLGDVITQGGGGLASFRDPLARLLSGENVAGANPAGLSFDATFVGSNRVTYDYWPWITDYSATLAAHLLHEGHAGWSVRDMLDGLPDAPISTGAARVSDWLLGYTADIALLNLGTDSARAQTGNPQPDFAGRITAEIGAAIEAIKANNPAAIVFLAKPPPNLYWSAPLETIVGLIDGIAAEKNAAALAPYIAVVDQHSGFDTNTMLAGNGLQPNAAGEAFLAARWFEALAPLFQTIEANRTRVGNLSSRALVGTGSEVVIPGFVISGTGTKRLLIRGVGPALAEFGVEGALSAPTMTLFSGGQALATNTGWSGSAHAIEIAQTAEALGAFPLPADSADSALLVRLAPGEYTVNLSGAGSTSGVSLMEIYDADTSVATARLANISSRARVGTGSDVLIPGYVVSGSLRLLIRAVGPGLEQYGVTDFLPDPTLTIFSDTDILRTNDNWGENEDRDELLAAAAAVGAFDLPEGSRDGAALVTLPAGAYTVRVSGVGGTTGVALVEIYEVP